MKVTRGIFVFCVLFFAMAAGGQTIQHIIIAVQENRTPDNLFGASGIAGIDATCSPKGAGVPLNGGANPGHKYQDFKNNMKGHYGPGSHNCVTSGAEPYWQLATQYGFANRMFQTNRSDSYPAHQFLVSATSVAADDSDAYITDRASGAMGCAKPTLAPTITDLGLLGKTPACFARSSLLNLLDEAGLSWKWYCYSDNAMWCAPQSLESYYQSKNIASPTQKLLTDIANGRLPNVSWAIPAGGYSDHPILSSGGPAWIAAIVNAVGKSTYWKNTAIIVTWDDWGGFYDHVPPLNNDTGWCVEFCYGFRVPLLVISAYTPAYIDNDPHDFSSIMHFVETNFGLSNIGPGNWGDSYADDLSAFFNFNSPTPREFSPVSSRKMTRREIENRDDPDDD